MRSLFLSFVSLALTTPALAQPARTDVITGTVIARATGAAVTGALVTVEGTNLTATTSGTGRFVIEKAPAGPVALSVEAAGFVKQRLTEGNVEFTTGQFNTLKGIGRASGPVSNWGGYYVSVGKEQNSGYFKNLTTDDYTVGNTALFGKLTFNPDARSFGSISLNYVDSDNSTPTNEPHIDGRLLHDIDPRFDRFSNFNIPGPNYKQTNRTKCA